MPVFNRVIPFCPIEMTETQFGNWNANNKTQYFGPLDIEQVCRLYWDNKGFDIGITTSGSKMFDAVAWKWNGSQWVAWGGPPTDPPPAATTFNFPPGGALRVDTTSPDRDHLSCPARKDYGASSGTVFDTADGRYRWKFSGNIFFFADGFLQSSGISSGIVVNLVRRTSTDEYYVPFRLFTGFEIDPTQIFVEGSGSTIPPPPDHYGTPTTGNTSYNFSWNSANTSYSNASKPQLTWDVLGNTGTHLWNSSGQLTLATLDVHLLIDESDSTKFF